MLILNRLLPRLVAISGMIAIFAAVSVLPGDLFFVFKPLTTVLIIVFAWPRGAGQVRARRFIRIGLVLSLIGDIALMWPTSGFLTGLIAFLLVHLAYIAAFCMPVRMAAQPIVFVDYAVIIAPIPAVLWAGVPTALRVPFVAYVLCLATMAAQAAVWWRASAGKPDAALARHAAVGGLLFIVSDTILAVDKFAVPLLFAPLWILTTYWAAQWCIVSSLHPFEQPREAA